MFNVMAEEVFPSSNVRPTERHKPDDPVNDLCEMKRIFE